MHTSFEPGVQMSFRHKWMKLDTSEIFLHFNFNIMFVIIVASLTELIF